MIESLENCNDRADQKTGREDDDSLRFLENI